MADALEKLLHPLADKYLAQQQEMLAQEMSRGVEMVFDQVKERFQNRAPPEPSSRDISRQQSCPGRRCAGRNIAGYSEAISVMECPYFPCEEDCDIA